MLDWLLTIIGFNRGAGLAELARRMEVAPDVLQQLTPEYREFAVPKRSGGTRIIAAPAVELKQLQRALLRRVLAKLRRHPAAVGFESGESFVTNAARHCGRSVVLRFDIKDFFPSITAHRIYKYFRFVGWNRAAARSLTKLVSWQDKLPQGAPTSPRLSNLVNYRLDARLTGLAERYHATYTRYADDITISLQDESLDLRPLIGTVFKILRDEGYEPHRGRKFGIRRQHHQQRVTGLVVNQRVNLPRKTRRWLRAVEHRAAMEQAPITSPEWKPTKKPTLTLEQLAGWRGIVAMIDRVQQQ
jgi:RNA-directed DNA polymerase